MPLIVTRAPAQIGQLGGRNPDATVQVVRSSPTGWANTTASIMSGQHKAGTALVACASIAES
jgi:hypothetical protein